MFAISGELLTMRVRMLAFKALLRQVLHLYLLETFELFVKVFSGIKTTLRSDCLTI